MMDVACFTRFLKLVQDVNWLRDTPLFLSRMLPALVEFQSIGLVFTAARCEVDGSLPSRRSRLDGCFHQLAGSRRNGHELHSEKSLSRRVGTPSPTKPGWSATRSWMRRETPDSKRGGCTKPCFATAGARFREVVGGFVLDSP